MNLLFFHVITFTSPKLPIGFPTKGGSVRGNRRFPGFPGIRCLTKWYFYPNVVFGDFVLAYFHFVRLSKK